MNRRAFLALAGIAPALPLAAKHLEPTRFPYGYYDGYANIHRIIEAKIVAEGKLPALIEMKEEIESVLNHPSAPKRWVAPHHKLSPAKQQNSDFWNLYAVYDSNIRRVLRLPRYSVISGNGLVDMLDNHYNLKPMIDARNRARKQLQEAGEW